MSEEVKQQDQQLFTRGYIFNLLSQALLNVSRDLYNLECDDLSSITLHMSGLCADRSVDSRKDEIVKPREQVKSLETPTNLKVVKDCTCSCDEEQMNCTGHVNPGQDACQTACQDACQQESSQQSIESEVTEIVSQIRQEQNRG